MRYLWILILVGIISCQHATEKKVEKRIADPLAGYWQYLDKYGNYNEVHFDGKHYQTINRFVDKNVTFPYKVNNDSLYSTADRRHEGMTAVACIDLMDDGRVVLYTDFFRDTLYKLDHVKNTLVDTDPFSDSLSFYQAFYKRYEQFLIQRGIVTEEEILQFHEEGKVPEDVKRNSD